MRQPSSCRGATPIARHRPLPAQTIAYESILGAQVSVENCETTSGGDHPGLSCEVHYSNAMNSAVDKPPSVTAREFVLMYGVIDGRAG